jgi:hypothetical protein
MQAKGKLDDHRDTRHLTWSTHISDNTTCLLHIALAGGKLKLNRGLI